MPAAFKDKPGKVYVGNLPPAIEKEHLQEAFSKFGEISDSKLLIISYPGREGASDK